jgi:hypothetical protein
VTCLFHSILRLGFVELQSSNIVIVKCKNFLVMLYVVFAIGILTRDAHERRCAYDLNNPPEMSAQDRGSAKKRRSDGPVSNRKVRGRSGSRLARR